MANIVTLSLASPVDRACMYIGRIARARQSPERVRTLFLPLFEAVEKEPRHDEQGKRREGKGLTAAAPPRPSCKRGKR